MSSKRRTTAEDLAYGKIANITHEGWLLKEGHLDKKWKKRYVILKEKKLLYFTERKEGVTPQGIIDINGYMIELVDDQDLVYQLIKSDELALFQLMHPEKPTEFPPVRFCASNEQNLQDWFNSVLLEFSREFIRQSTYVDIGTLDAEVPDYKAFQARKKMAQIAELPEVPDVYQELELEEEDYAKLRQTRDSMMQREREISKEIELEKAERKPQPQPAVVSPATSSPASPTEAQIPALPPRPGNRNTKVFQNASAWETKAQEETPGAPDKEAKKNAVTEEIEREKKRLEEESANREKANELAQKKKAEEAAAAAARKKAEEELAAKKRKEEEEARKRAEEARKRAEEEQLTKRKADEEAAKKKAEEEAARKRVADEAAKQKKEEADAKKKKDEEAAETKKEQEEEAAAAAAKKKREEEEAAAKRKEEDRVRAEAAAASAPREVKKSAAMLEIERERERQQQEQEKKGTSAPQQTPSSLSKRISGDTPPLPPRSNSATSVVSPAPTPAASTTPSTQPAPSAAPALHKRVSLNAPALPSSAGGTSDSQKPYTSTEHNRITVVTAKPKATPVAAAGGAGGAAQSSASQPKLFNNRHNTLKDAAIDWINSRLGQDGTLKSKNLVPVTSANLVEKCRDGIILCKLVNTAVSKTLDDRAINLEGLSDPGQVKENLSLCLNSGRAIGCSFPNVFPETLMKGDEDLLVTTIAQFIQVYLRNRLKIMYDGDDLTLKCGSCSSAIDSQYGLKGPVAYCMTCISKPLTLINLFCTDGSGATSSPAIRSVPVMPEMVDGTKQPDFIEVVKILDGISDRFAKLTDKDISEGKGTPLLNDMKALMPKLGAVSKKYQVESYDLVQRYNVLTKDIPERINKGYKNTGDSQVVVTTSGLKCTKCQKALSGQTVEVFGNTYHQECFGCFGCGRALTKSCLNVDNKPYCEGCGKKAFIQSRMRK